MSNVFPLAFYFPFALKDALDILLVSVLLYQLYKILKGTVAINIFIGIIIIYLIGLIVESFEMRLLGSIIRQFIGVGGIALVVLFQQEIRKFFIIIGMRSWNSTQVKALKKWFPFLNRSSNVTFNYDAVVQASFKMASTYTGAIMVISNESDLSFYESSGDKIEAKLSSRLLESIFFKNSPLHDGAVVIQQDTIKAVRCVLPVTENDAFPPHLGMRHRAAVGVTEVSDCIAIIVSEESGTVSYARSGKLRQKLSEEELYKLLKKDFRKA